jgi:hypothetical protein
VVRAPLAGARRRRDDRVSGAPTKERIVHVRTRHSHRAGHRLRVARQRDWIDNALGFLWLRAARWYVRRLMGTARPILIRRAGGAALAVAVTGAMLALGRALVHAREERVPTS